MPQVVDKNLHYEVYDQGKIPALTQSILTGTIERLRDSNPHYKYIGTSKALPKPPFSLITIIQWIAHYCKRVQLLLVFIRRVLVSGIPLQMVCGGMGDGRYQNLLLEWGYRKLHFKMGKQTFALYFDCFWSCQYWYCISDRIITNRMRFYKILKVILILLQYPSWIPLFYLFIYSYSNSNIIVLFL